MNCCCCMFRGIVIFKKNVFCVTRHFAFHWRHSHSSTSLLLFDSTEHVQSVPLCFHITCAEFSLFPLFRKMFNVFEAACSKIVRLDSVGKKLCNINNNNCMQQMGKKREGARVGRRGRGRVGARACPQPRRQCTNLLEPLPSHPRGSLTLRGLRSRSCRESVAGALRRRAGFEKFWNGECCHKIQKPYVPLPPNVRSLGRAVPTLTLSSLSVLLSCRHLLACVCSSY